LEEKNKSLSSSGTSSSWRNADKVKEDSKLFGSNRGEKDRREGGFGRNRDDGPPRSIFNNRGNDSKSGAYGARDNDRGGWNRGGSGISSGGAFDKSFKEGGMREGGRSAFDRDMSRKPTSNDQVN